MKNLIIIYLHKSCFCHTLTILMLFREVYLVDQELKELPFIENQRELLNAILQAGAVDAFKGNVLGN